mgnify:FL=1
MTENESMTAEEVIELVISEIPSFIRIIKDKKFPLEFQEEAIMAFIYSSAPDKELLLLAIKNNVLLRAKIRELIQTIN